jgi:hypothetical protein
MIGQISPLVKVGTISMPRLAMHVAGGALGGLVSGLLLGFVGQALVFVLGPQPISAAAGLAPLVLMVLGASDLGLGALPRPTGSRQTPGYWSCSFGPSWGLFAWGVDLGNGLTTKVPHQVLLGLMVIATLSGHLLVAVMVMSAYGLARACAIAMAVLTSRATDVGEISSRINVRELTINNIVGASALALGVTMAITIA